VCARALARFELLATNRKKERKKERKEGIRKEIKKERKREIVKYFVWKVTARERQ
jgi:hypothetical protein